MVCCRGAPIAPLITPTEEIALVGLLEGAGRDVDGEGAGLERDRLTKGPGAQGEAGLQRKGILVWSAAKGDIGVALKALKGTAGGGNAVLWRNCHKLGSAMTLPVAFQVTRALQLG
jgi:hypothetical protein